MAKATLHAQVLYGRDNHHKVEGLFKAFGRALKSAVALDPRRGDQIPSSKGVL
jgi:imidazoleglycerol-phosphate dehydratase